jgi:hypothetical protein
MVEDGDLSKNDSEHVLDVQDGFGDYAAMHEVCWEVADQSTSSAPLRHIIKTQDYREVVKS